MKIETTRTAYVMDANCMSRFVDDLAKGNESVAAERVSFAAWDMSDVGWIKVGTARITVELLDPKEIQHGQLAALQARLQKERADSQVRQNAILDAISKLQALEWEGVEA